MVALLSFNIRHSRALRNTELACLFRKGERGKSKDYQGLTKGYIDLTYWHSITPVSKRCRKLSHVKSNPYNVFNHSARSSFIAIRYSSFERNGRYDFRSKYPVPNCWSFVDVDVDVDEYDRSESVNESVQAENERFDVSKQWWSSLSSVVVVVVCVCLTPLSKGGGGGDSIPTIIIIIVDCSAKLISSWWWRGFPVVRCVGGGQWSVRVMFGEEKKKFFNLQFEWWLVDSHVINQWMNESVIRNQSIIM